MKNLTAQQMREQIRAQIKKDSQEGIWWNFWRNLELNSVC